MPKLSDKDRLAALELRRHEVDEEIEAMRRSLRMRYAMIAQELPIERLDEGDFKGILTHAIKVGGTPALTALKALSAS